MKVVLHPQADAEFLLAQQRYTDASPLLGRRFYDEITSVFRRIIEHPLRYMCASINRAGGGSGLGESLRSRIGQ